MLASRDDDDDDDDNDDNDDGNDSAIVREKERKRERGKKSEQKVKQKKERKRNGTELTAHLGRILISVAVPPVGLGPRTLVPRAQENVVYFAQSPERCSYIGAYPPSGDVDLQGPPVG